MAVLATLFERAFVRIRVAIETTRKLHVPVARRPARHVRLVALLAGHLYVQTSQRITRLGMVELFGCFPIVEIVALQAVVSELSLVGIFMAGQTIL